MTTCLRCDDPVRGPGESFCATHQQIVITTPVPIFWWLEVDELREELATARSKTAHLRAALDIATKGTEPREDLVWQLATLLERYAPKDNPTVESLLTQAESMGWERN